MDMVSRIREALRCGKPDCRCQGLYADKHCPAHPVVQGRPTLSIESANGDAALFRCQHGCGQFTVVDALRERGLWPRTPGRPSPLQPDRIGLKG